LSSIAFSSANEATNAPSRCDTCAPNAPRQPCHAPPDSNRGWLTRPASAASWTICRICRVFSKLGFRSFNSSMRQFALPITSGLSVGWGVPNRSDDTRWSFTVRLISVPVHFAVR